jgi:hypothetical protein
MAHHMMRLVFSGSRREAEAYIRQLPGMLAGTIPDPVGLSRRLQLRAGVALLSQIQQDFITKSRGGTGRDGIQWPPLKPETIAARRTTKGEKKSLGIGKGERPSLTAAQDAAWRKKFASVLAWAVAEMGEAEAKAYAGRVAWHHVKTAMGAKTVLELLGSRQVDMLRDTGELFRSLTPGVADRPEEGQILRPEAGRVVVGTNKKPWHHEGTSTIPARPLWPLDGSIPSAWWPAINNAITSGISEAIPDLIGGA